MELDNDNAIENPDNEVDNPQPPIEEEPIEVGIPIWEYKNIPDFYNRVRGALNIGNTLSDTTIDYFENAPMAEMIIKKRVPQWEELDNLKRLLFETCIIYQTCYILCPQFSSSRITKMKDPSLEVDYATNVNEKPCARFAELIDDLIAQINEEEQPPFFLGFEVTKSALNDCPCRRKLFPHIIQHKPVKDNIEGLPEEPDISIDDDNIDDDFTEPDIPIEGELPETPDSPNENTPLGAE